MKKENKCLVTVWVTQLQHKDQ